MSYQSLTKLLPQTTPIVEEMIATAALLSVVIIPIILWSGLGLQEALPIAVLLGLAGHCLLRILSRSQADIFAPNTLIAAYFTLYFAARALYVLSIPNADHLGFLPYEDYLPYALWCGVLAYLAFAVGYYGNTAHKLLELIHHRPSNWPAHIPVGRIAVVSAAGAASTLYLFSIGQVVGNLNNAVFLNNPPPGIPILLESGISFGWLATCVCLFREKGWQTERASWFLIALSLVFIGAKVAITGGKQGFLEPLIESAIAFHYLRQKISILKLFAIGVPAIAIAFGIINTYRFVIVGKLEGPPRSFQDVSDRLAVAFDYFSSNDNNKAGEKSAIEQMMERQAGVDALALVMKYTPERKGFSYGINYIEMPFLTFIPRQLWENKPVYTPTLDFERVYMGVPPDFNGFSSMHMISDLYQNFYYFGVAIGMFVVGFSLRLLYLLCSPYQGNRTGVFLYAALLPGIVHYLEQDVVSVANSVSRQLLLLIGITLFIGARYYKEYWLK